MQESGEEFVVGSEMESMEIWRWESKALNEDLALIVDDANLQILLSVELQASAFVG